MQNVILFNEFPEGPPPGRRQRLERTKGSTRPVGTPAAQQNSRHNALRAVLFVCRSPAGRQMRRWNKRRLAVRWRGRRRYRSRQKLGECGCGARVLPAPVLKRKPTFGWFSDGTPRLQPSTGQSRFGHLNGAQLSAVAAHRSLRARTIISSSAVETRSEQPTAHANTFTSCVSGSPALRTVSASD